MYFKFDWEGQARNDEQRAPSAFHSQSLWRGSMSLLKATKLVPDEHGSAWGGNGDSDEVHTTTKPKSRSASSRQPSGF